MKIEIKKLSKNLKNLREKKKLTQEELARSLGVSRQSIISLEQGRCLPSLPLAISFADLFEMSFEQIFCEEVSVFHREVKKIIDQDYEAIEKIDTIFDENTAKNKIVGYPITDLIDNEKNIEVFVELPGVEEGDIVLEIVKDAINLSFERNSVFEKSAGNYIFQEIKYGNFSRTIPLPSMINEAKVKANLKSGVLRIILPKIKKITPKIVRIKIKNG